MHLPEPDLDWRYKGIPPSSQNVPVGEIGSRGWNVLRGDLLLPILLVKRDALEHNLQAMADFCAARGVSLAPHAKTTMSPEITRKQLDKGAWGFTAATTSQVVMLRRFGVDRIILANQVVEPSAIRVLLDEVAAGATIYCLADSIDGVRLLADSLRAAKGDAELRVLVELGLEKGRTGCRSPEEAAAIAAEVARSPGLLLAGVEGYEGIITAGALDDTLEVVDVFLDRIYATTAQLVAAGAFSGVEEVIVSAGGSAFFDRAVERLGTWDRSAAVRLVLRSGCYVTHDSLFYESLSPAGAAPRVDFGLRPALEAWGAVLSRPEPDLAIVGFGKRDVPYDIDLPLPTRIRRRSGRLEQAPAGLQVEALNDQHAYVRVADGELAVGDWLGCGVSHPCTAFDKWRLIPVVDDEYNVVDALTTYF